MSSMDFVKMEGAGNDFVVTSDPDLPETPEWIAAVCNRRRGIGADGLIVLSRTGEDRFRMRYYNSDGSRAGMCGNGLRCCMEYTARRGLSGDHALFDTDSGELEAWRIAPELVRIRLAPPKPFRQIRIGDFACFVTSTGVPHAVIPVRNGELDRADLIKIGREIRFSKELAPEGANVDLIEFEEQNVLRIRTYERGVEDETLACGTGMAAAAAYAFLFRGSGAEVKLKTAGGDILSAKLDGDMHGVKGIFLSGPAKCVFSGTYEY